MKGGDRNKPCWCGSGKKYKKCHLGSDNQKKTGYPDIDSQGTDSRDTNSRNETGQIVSAIGAYIDNYESDKCRAKDAGLGACSGKIRKAHPVSRDSGLSEISRFGKIIEYDFGFAKSENNNDELLLEVNEEDTEMVSVFYGFCQKHDRSLFSCFGNEDFTGRPDQCLAIACRNISQVLITLESGMDLQDIHSKLNMIVSPENQDDHDSFINNYILNNKNNLKSIRDRLFQSLVKKEYGIIQSLIIKFDALLPYMVTDYWSPDIDIYGQELHNTCETNPEKILMSSFVDKNCSYICMSWLDINDAPGKVIAKQIKNLSPDQQSEVIMSLAMLNMITVVFNPDWFKSLNSDQRKILDALASCCFETTDVVPSPIANLNVNLDLPKVERVFYSHNGS